MVGARIQFTPGVATADLQDHPVDAADGNTAPAFAKGSSEISFDFLAELEMPTLLSLLQSEHPQSVAMIVSQLEPQRAVEVLGLLDPKTQSDIVHRIANLDPGGSGAIRRVEGGLKKSVSTTDAPELGERSLG